MDTTAINIEVNRTEFNKQAPSMINEDGQPVDKADTEALDACGFLEISGINNKIRIHVCYYKED